MHMKLKGGRIPAQVLHAPDAAPVRAHTQVRHIQPYHSAQPQP